MIELSTPKQFELLNPGKRFPDCRELSPAETRVMRTALAARLGLKRHLHDHEGLGLEVLYACKSSPEVRFWKGEELNRGTLSEVLGVELPEVVIIAFEDVKRLYEVRLSEVLKLFHFSGLPGWTIGDGVIVISTDAQWTLDINRDGQVGWIGPKDSVSAA